MMLFKYFSLNKGEIFIITATFILNAFDKEAQIGE